MGRNNSARLLKIILWGIFVIYCAFMLWQLLFAYRRMSGTIYKYNLIPFKTILYFLLNTHGKYKIWSIVRNLPGNIVMFIPLGFFLSIFSKQGKGLFWRVVIKTAVIMSIIEIIQGITHLGMLDIDDVILNTVGGMLGYLLFKILVQFRTLANTNSANISYK